MDDLLDEVGVDLDAMLGIEPDEPEPKPPPGVRVDPRRHKVVCKHWLRGLCKKGDDCDFLHQLDRDRMPECWFFSNFGECSNKDCIFLHIRPEDKVSTACAKCPCRPRAWIALAQVVRLVWLPTRGTRVGLALGSHSLSNAFRTSPHPTLGPRYPSPHAVQPECARCTSARGLRAASASTARAAETGTRARSPAPATSLASARTGPSASSATRSTTAC